MILIMAILASLICPGCSQSGQSTSTNRFNVPAMTNWHKESGIRVPGAVSPCTIILSSGQCRIFYPGDGGIKSAISSDGLTFTEEAGLRVSHGSGTDYDAKSAQDADIIIESGYYRMYYTAKSQDDKLRAMSAISTDGFTFTKEAGVRIDYSASYDQLASVPSAVKISANNYKIYFVYDFNGDNSIKGATSSDGLSWEVKTLSGFEKNCMDPEVLLNADGTLIMFIAASRTDDSPEPLDIYKATSSDGISWTIVGQALVPEKSEEGKLIGDPDVIKLPDGTYRMYYYGMTVSDSNLLSATAESL